MILNNEVLWSKEIKRMDLLNLIQLLDPYKEELDFSLDMDCSYKVGFKENGRIRRNYCHSSEPYYVLEEYLKQPDILYPNKIFLVLENPERFTFIFSLLEEAFKGRLHITSSGPSYIELVVEGVSKGKALEILAEKMGFSLDQTAAIGDERNDLDMLKNCPHGFLMSHAGEHMKAQIPNTMDSVHDLIDWCLRYNENCV